MTNKLQDLLTNMHKELISNDYMTDEEREKIRALVDEVTNLSFAFLQQAKAANLMAQIVAIWENAQERKKKEST